MPLTYSVSLEIHLTRYIFSRTGGEEKAYEWDGEDYSAKVR